MLIWTVQIRSCYFLQFSKYNSFQMIVYKLVCMQCNSLQILLYRIRYFESSYKTGPKSVKDNLELTAWIFIKLLISVPLLNMTSAAPLSVVLSLLSAQSQRKKGKRGRSVSHIIWLIFERGTKIINKLLLYRIQVCLVGLYLQRGYES